MVYNLQSYIKHTNYCIVLWSACRFNRTFLEHIVSATSQFLRRGANGVRLVHVRSRVVVGCRCARACASNQTAQTTALVKVQWKSLECAMTNVAKVATPDVVVTIDDVISAVHVS